MEGCGSEMLQIVCKWDIFLGKGPGYRQLGGAGGAAEPGTGNIYIYILRISENNHLATFTPVSSNEHGPTPSVKSHPVEPGFPLRKTSCKSIHPYPTIPPKASNEPASNNVLI